MQHRASRFVKSRYTRYFSVSDMIDVLGWPPLSQIKQEARLMPIEGVLIEAYKGTRRKHHMKFRQVGHTTMQYGQLFSHKTKIVWNGIAFAEAPAVSVFRSNSL